MTEKSLAEIRAEVRLKYPQLFVSDSKFTSKLTKTQRCEIFALHLLDINKRILARAYSVNRSTISFIVNSSSPHYKSVRKEAIELGREAFIKQYATHEVINSAMSFADEPEVELSDDELVEKKSTNSGASRRANSAAGPFSFTSLITDGILSATVEWHDNPGPSEVTDTEHADENRPPGWYVRHEGVFYGHVANSHSSTKARDGFLTNIGGTLV